MAVLGIDTVVWVGALVVVAVAGLVVILAAPWKSVRRERPLDPDIEARLLLGEDPATVAVDADAADARRARVVDLGADRADRADADRADRGDEG